MNGIIAQPTLNSALRNLYALKENQKKANLSENTDVISGKPRKGNSHQHGAKPCANNDAGT